MSELFCYEFGQFQLDPIRRVLRKDGEIVPVAAKVFDLLLILLENSNHPISKSDLMRQVWAESNTVTDNTFNVTLSNARKALGESGKAPHYIIRTSNGYRFVAEVCKFPANGEQTPSEPNVAEQSASLVPNSLFSGQRWFVITSGVLYGFLYAIALLVEVAYRFDHYRRGALFRAPIVWLFAGAVAIGAFTIDWWLTRAGRRGGLVGALGITALGIGALVAVVWLYLPPVPITEMDQPAYTAQAAYLKTVVYFLFLQLLFLLLPFHFVMVMQRELEEGRTESLLDLLSGNRWSIVPRGTVFIRVWVLALIFATVMFVSLLLHHNLMSHLRPAQYMNLFAILIWIRLLLFHTLGGVSLWWYYQALNELKRACLNIHPLANHRSI